MTITANKRAPRKTQALRKRRKIPSKQCLCRLRVKKQTLWNPRLKVRAVAGLRGRRERIVHRHGAHGQCRRMPSRALRDQFWRKNPGEPRGHDFRCRHRERKNSRANALPRLERESHPVGRQRREPGGQRDGERNARRAMSARKKKNANAAQSQSTGRAAASKGSSSLPGIVLLGTAIVLAAVLGGALHHENTLREQKWAGALAQMQPISAQIESCAKRLDCLSAGPDAKVDLGLLPEGAIPCEAINCRVDGHTTVSVSENGEV